MSTMKRVYVRWIATGLITAVPVCLMAGNIGFGLNDKIEFGIVLVLAYMAYRLMRIFLMYPPSIQYAIRIKVKR
jgi:hypothetical protein